MLNFLQRKAISMVCYMMSFASAHILAYIILQPVALQQLFCFLSFHLHTSTDCQRVRWQEDRSHIHLEQFKLLVSNQERMRELTAGSVVGNVEFPVGRVSSVVREVRF